MPRLTLCLAALLALTGCTHVTEDTGPLGLSPWAKSFKAGNSGYVYGTQVASGPDGQVFFGGTFSDSIDLGGGVLPADSGSSVFVAELDADGNHQWSGNTGSNDYLISAAFGPDGDMYVAGMYDGAINFGSGKLTGYKNGYLAAFFPGGKSNFSKALGGEAEDWVDDVAVAPSGNVVVVARAGDDADFNGGVTGIPYSKKDAVVAMYTPEGDLLWSTRIPDAVSTSLMVATDSSGNVFVAGRSWTTITLGSLTAESGNFVAKLSAGGAPLWLRATSSAGGTYPDFFDMAVAPDDSVVVTGSFNYGQFAIAGLGSGYTEDNDGFWMRLSSGGDGVTFERLGTQVYYGPVQVGIAPNGDVVLGLTMFYPADFGGGLVSNGPLQNAVLVRFSAEGEHIRSLELGGANNEYLIDLAVDPDGNTVVLGWFDQSVEIGESTFTTDGSTSIFVARTSF